MMEEGRKTPGYWTVRSPYPTFCEEGDEEAAGQQDALRSTAPFKKQRTTRLTPAYLPNFVKQDEYHKERLFNTLNETYFLPSGCGTGFWAIAMAREFPHARVHGVDLVPAFQRHAKSASANSNGQGAQEEDVDGGIPRNCTFEIDDINRGLDHFANSFDLVHVRLIAVGIKNYRRFMEEVTRCLKPGGLAIFIEGDYELLAEDRMTVIPMAVSEEEIAEAGGRRRSSEERSSSLWTRGSWLQRFYYEVRYASQFLGSDMSAAGAAVDEGLWRMDLLDPDTCGAASLFTPVGPWARSRGDYGQTKELQFAGSVMRKVLLNGIRAYQPFFLRVGVSQSTLDHWTGAIDHELQSQKFHSWLRLRIAWGRRKDDSSSSGALAASPPLERAAPIPLTISTDPPISLESGGDLTQHQLRLLSQIQRLVQQSQCQLVVYESREECLMAKEARQLTRLKEPVSHVRRIWEAKNRKENQDAARAATF
ncbi:S-adenosyl-L-methionine-dependent methyltransferase [Serendipita vermifera]|nr:S-adenosyl-L-methionine-dependent methyltransferase [Serendipita vermifera]